MPDLSPVRWRKSSYSTGGGNCIEVATLADGRIAIRDSKNPASGLLVVPRAGMTAWLAAIKAGDL